MSIARARKRIVFRQFHTESFVITYVETGQTTPAKARETYLSLGPDAFEETFEMAEPGKPFAVYSKTSFRRVK